MPTESYYIHRFNILVEENCRPNQLKILTGNKCYRPREGYKKTIFAEGLEIRILNAKTSL